MKRLFIVPLLLSLVILSSCRGPEKYTKEATDWLESIIESTEDMPDVWDEEKGLLISSHHTLRELISAIESAKEVEDITGICYEPTIDTPLRIGTEIIGTAEMFQFRTSDDKLIMFYFNQEYTDYFKAFVIETLYDKEAYTNSAANWLGSLIESTVDTPDVWDKESGLIVNSHHTLNELINAVKSAEAVTDVTDYTIETATKETLIIGSQALCNTKNFFFFNFNSRIIDFQFNQEYADYFTAYLDEVKRAQ